MIHAIRLLRVIVAISFAFASALTMARAGFPLWLASFLAVVLGVTLVISTNEFFSFARRKS